MRITVRLSGPPMLVTGLAKQGPRPKRIGPLALPLATFGGPLIAGVRYMDIYYKRKPGSKGICHRLRHGSMNVSSKAKSMPLKSFIKGKNVMLFASDQIVCLCQ